MNSVNDVNDLPFLPAGAMPTTAAKLRLGDSAWVPHQTHLDRAAHHGVVTGLSQVGHCHVTIMLRVGDSWDRVTLEPGDAVYLTNIEPKLPAPRYWTTRIAAAWVRGAVIDSHVAGNCMAARKCKGVNAGLRRLGTDDDSAQAFRITTDEDSEYEVSVRRTKA